MDGGTNHQRKYHLDLLRILAAFSVVMLHVAAQFWYSLDVNGAEWKIANGYDACFRFGVPIFVMISGALWLGEDKPLDVKKLYTRNILRLAVIYVVWSCLYGLMRWKEEGGSLEKTGAAKGYVLEMLVNGNYLWFFPMIIGLYMLIPILRSWISNAAKENLRYFLWLFFFVQIVGETAKALIPSEGLRLFLNLNKIDMVCGYLGYFVLGYYLAEVGIPQKYQKWLYAGVLPAAVLNIVISTRQSVKAGAATGEIYDSYGLFTFVIATALFVFFTSQVSRVEFGERSIRWIRELSADTLGIYVIHIGVIEWTAEYGLHSRTLPNGIGIPLYALFCFAVCALIAAFLRRLPLVGRYLC